MNSTKEANDIYDAFGRQLQAFICQKANHHDDCHDILQNVFIRVLNKMHLVRQADALAPYLFGIARNEVVNHYRTTFKYEPIELTAWENIAENDEGQPSQIDESYIRAVIHTLPAIYRDALILTHLGDLSQKALAKKLGISISGAKSRVQRAREKLKEQIVKNCPPPNYITCRSNGQT